jgi:hypothetical protein
MIEVVPVCGFLYKFSFFAVYFRNPYLFLRGRKIILLENNVERKKEIWDLILMRQ